MPTQQPDIAGREEDDEEGGGIDFARIKQLAGFFVRAARRRPKVASLTLVAGLVIVGFLAAYLPRTYTVDVRFLAQRNLLLPALDNPGANIPQDSGSLTRDVADTIKRRDNMIELARQVDLLARWRATRPAVLRLKDRMIAMISGPTSDEDALKGLIVTLEQRLEVTVDASSVTISVDWPERQIAFDMVSTLSQNFVEARYDSEIAVINEAIEILDHRAKEQGANVDAALADIVKLEALRRAKGTALAPTPDAPPGAQPATAPAPVRAGAPPTVAPPPVAPADDSADDIARLAQVRRDLGDLEAEQKRRVADAERQLDDARVTLGPMHPTVVALAQKIDTLKQPSAEMLALRAEERQILARVSSYAHPDTGTPAPAPTQQVRPSFTGGGAPRPAPRPAATPFPELSSQDDPQLYAARAKLATATSSYSELLRRIESAQIQLDVSRASFKYQYITVRPPELPTKPRKPNVPALVIGGVLATILLALGLAGIADLMSGRILEPWQVEHRLKLTILGELPPPKS